MMKSILGKFAPKSKGAEENNGVEQNGESSNEAFLSKMVEV